MRAQNGQKALVGHEVEAVGGVGPGAAESPTHGRQGAVFSESAKRAGGSARGQGITHGWGAWEPPCPGHPQA